MFKRAGQVLLIIAVLAATGSHWVLLQSIAWSTMLVNNLETHSLHDAVTLTFGGSHPCALCKKISQGKQTEKNTEFEVSLKKLEFVSTGQPIFFNPPADFRLQPAFDHFASAMALKPPVPPPRGLFA